MVAVGLCASFSGLTGLGLALAILDGGASGSGFDMLACGVAGLVGVISLPLRAPWAPGGPPARSPRSA